MSDNEVLVVVSKLKNYIKSTANMNTAGNVAPRLSQDIKRMCDRAIANAKSDGRKTIMDKDFD